MHIPCTDTPAISRLTYACAANQVEERRPWHASGMSAEHIVLQGNRPLQVQVQMHWHVENIARLRLQIVKLDTCNAR